MMRALSIFAPFLQCLSLADTAGSYGVEGKHSCRQIVVSAAVIAILAIGMPMTFWAWQMWRSYCFFDAARRGDVEEITRLLDHGMAVDARDPLDGTPMMLASENGRLEVVNCLIGRGADVTARDAWNGTALMYACVNGHLEIVVALLEAGVPVDERSRMEGTPIMCAAQRAQFEIVQYLLEQGADTTLTDEKGRTALVLAREKGFSRIARILQAYNQECRREMIYCFSGQFATSTYPDAKTVSPDPLQSELKNSKNHPARSTQRSSSNAANVFSSIGYHARGSDLPTSLSGINRLAIADSR